MRFAMCFKILGVLLMMFSLSMLTPLIVDAIYHQSMYLAFLVAFGLTFITGVVFWFPVRHLHYELRTRDGFLWSHYCGLCYRCLDQYLCT